MAIFNKTYSVPVHRKIAQGTLIPTDINRADIFIEASGSLYPKITNINSVDYQSTIYNIRRERNLIITSNTLNLSITDKYIEGIPLYNKVKYDTNFEYTLITDYLLNKYGTNSYLVEDDLIYFNDPSHFLVIDSLTKPITDAYYIGNSFSKLPTTKIERLKDRLKITLEVENPQNFSIKLNFKTIFEPILHQNWIEIPECVFKDINNNYIHVYNHTFESIEKTEIQKTHILNLQGLKDPLYGTEKVFNTEPLNDKYTKIIYNTYRTNLLFNINLNDSLYFYLDLNYIDKTNPFIFSPTPLLSNRYLFMFQISNKIDTSSVSLIANPYTKTEIYEAKGEVYSLIIDSNESQTKYANEDNILLGNTKFLLNLERLIHNKTVYLSNTDTNVKIYQKDNINLINSNITSEDVGDSTFSLELSNTISNCLNLGTTFEDEIKIYEVSSFNE